MRVPTLAVYTLAALAALDLTHEATATSATLSPDQALEPSNFVVPVKASTPERIETVAPPETLVAQQFSSAGSRVESSQSSDVQYYKDYQPAVSVPTMPAEVTPAPSPAAKTTASPSRPISVSQVRAPDPGTVPAPGNPSLPGSTVPGSTVIDTAPVRSTPQAPARVNPPANPILVNPPAINNPPANNPNDLAVTATDVQVVGANEALQQIVLDTIQTRPGADTSQGQLQSDVATILETGLFSNATVNSQVNPAGLSVVFQVEPVVVRSLQLSGAQVLPLSVANNIFKAQLGTTVNPDLLRQGVQQVNQWYQQNGYSLARVLALRPNREGVLALEVAEGVIGDINIRFLSREGKTVDDQGQPVKGRTREDFLRREIKLKPGQVFRQDAARQDVQQLYQLGLFEDVNIALGGDARQVDLTYELIEAPARAANLGGGYNDDTGIFGTISYRDQNIGGTNQQLGVNVQASQRDLQFDGNFVNPYRASEPDRLGYGANVFRRRGISQVFNDEIPLANGERVREGRFGGGFTVNRPVGEWQASAGLNYTRVSLRDREGNVVTQDVQGNPLSFSGTGIDDLTTASLALTRDQRDNPINPTQGSFLRLSTEQSVPVGSGSILMNRLQANYTQYVPVRVLDSGDGKEPEVLAFNVQGGTTLGDLPPYNAFVLGGTNSVRGYKEGEVGVGRSYVLASAEYRFPIFTSPVGGVLFADYASDLGSGNTVLGEPAIVRGRPGDGFGYGAGIRLRSPIGTIRADYGFNASGEGRLQVGIGQKF